MVNIEDIVKESPRVYTRAYPIKSLKTVPKSYKTVRDSPDFPYEIINYLESVPVHHVPHFRDFGADVPYALVAICYLLVRKFQKREIRKSEFLDEGD